MLAIWPFRYAIASLSPVRATGPGNVRWSPTIPRFLIWLAIGPSPAGRPTRASERTSGSAKGSRRLGGSRERLPSGAITPRSLRRMIAPGKAIAPDRLARRPIGRLRCRRSARPPWARGTIALEECDRDAALAVRSTGLPGSVGAAGFPGGSSGVSLASTSMLLARRSGQAGARDDDRRCSSDVDGSSGRLALRRRCWLMATA
jgi:hypothetical protein